MYIPTCPHANKTNLRLEFCSQFFFVNIASLVVVTDKAAKTRCPPPLLPQPLQEESLAVGL